MVMEIMAIAINNYAFDRFPPVNKWLMRARKLETAAYLPDFIGRRIFIAPCFVKVGRNEEFGRNMPA
jgi:hypothetical protein